MCLDFDGHHSGGSSFDMTFGFCYKMWAITHRYRLAFKKKNQVKSPSHGLASRKPVRIRHSGRAGIWGVTQLPTIPHFHVFRM